MKKTILFLFIFLFVIPLFVIYGISWNTLAVVFGSVIITILVLIGISGLGGMKDFDEKWWKEYIEEWGLKSALERVETEGRHSGFLLGGLAVLIFVLLILWFN